MKKKITIKLVLNFKILVLFDRSKYWWEIINLFANIPYLCKMKLQKEGGTKGFYIAGDKNMFK